jgi:hypothetical protein
MVFRIKLAQFIRFWKNQKVSGPEQMALFKPKPALRRRPMHAAFLSCKFATLCVRKLPVAAQPKVGHPARNGLQSSIPSSGLRLRRRGYRFPDLPDS